MIEALLPARLGRNFRWLFALSSVSNLADGIMLSAGPLLVASVTRDPFLVAMAVFLQQVPWLLFGVAAGALIDRLDRRLLTVTVDLCRATILAVLAGTVATGVVNVWVVLVTMFLLGTAETFADNASSTLVAVAVPKEHLGLANSRFFGSAILGNQLAGPPLGALLFATGSADPVRGQRRVLPARRGADQQDAAADRHPGVGPAARCATTIAEGMQWLWGHAPVRTLAVTLTLFNVTFGSAMAVYVLYAHRRLGLGDVGFGLLLMVGAVGGLVGSSAYSVARAALHDGAADADRSGRGDDHPPGARAHRPGLGRRPDDGDLRRARDGLGVDLHYRPAARGARAPARRVTSVYLLGAVGGLALGSLLGGVIAQRWGVVAPFWFGFAGSAVLTVTMWRSFARIAHAAEVGPEDEGIDAALLHKPR